MHVSFHPPTNTPQDATKPRKVLVTGAAGRIGSAFAAAARDDYELTLMVQNVDAERSLAIKPHGRLVEGRLEDIERLKELCAGIDTVVHLAADPSPSATWDSLHANNIIGTYHLLAAAKAAGCRRVILASSIHTVSGYPSEQQVKTHDPVNPEDLYGVSKCFGEAMGRYMAEREQLSCIALRIGWFTSAESIRKEHSPHGLEAWLSPRDFMQLLKLCIENTSLKFAVFNAISDNRFKRLDISDARELLGYAPKDDAFAEHEAIQTETLPDTKAETPPINRKTSGLRNEL
ncbi:MAG: NAD-dependent epimerase/dehydratase family protein [Opitutales bacterium]